MLQFRVRNIHEGYSGLLPTLRTYYHLETFFETDFGPHWRCLAPHPETIYKLDGEYHGHRSVVHMRRTQDPVLSIVNLNVRLEQGNIYCDYASAPTTSAPQCMGIITDNPGVDSGDRSCGPNPDGSVVRQALDLNIGRLDPSRNSDVEYLYRDTIAGTFTVEQNCQRLIQYNRNFQTWRGKYEYRS